MTLIAEQMKTCRDCGQSKPLTEFHIRKTSKTKFDFHPYCKPCHRIRIKTVYNVNSKNKDHTTASVMRLIELMASEGIYAEPGKLRKHSHVDLIAWGCVRIEVKKSKIHKASGFSFGVSYGQRDGFKAELVILACDWGEHETYHVFPAMFPKFYKGGKIREKICVTPNPKFIRNHDSLTWPDMKRHENAWEYIENVRSNKSRELRGLAPIGLGYIGTPIRQLKLSDDG